MCVEARNGRALLSRLLGGRVPLGHRWAYIKEIFPFGYSRHSVFAYRERRSHAV